MTSTNEVHELVELHKQTETILGSLLFTVLDWNATDRSFARLFSSRSDLSEPGVIKQGAVSNNWLQSCIYRQESYLGATRADIAATYGEWKQLLQAGCATSMNVPVVAHDGQTVGIINTFAGAGVYDKQTLTQLEQMISQRRGGLSEAITAAGTDLRRRLL